MADRTRAECQLAATQDSIHAVRMHLRILSRRFAELEAAPGGRSDMTPEELVEYDLMGVTSFFEARGLLQEVGSALVAVIAEGAQTQAAVAAVHGGYPGTVVPSPPPMRRGARVEITDAQTGYLGRKGIVEDATPYHVTAKNGSRATRFLLRLDGLPAMSFAREEFVLLQPQQQGGAA